MSVEPTPQSLADQLAIRDVLHRYASALDTKDWPDLHHVFSEEIRADFRAFGVKTIFRGRAEEWIRLMEGSLGGMDTTQHLMANHRYRLQGRQRATGTTYIQATHVCRNDAGGDRYVVGGRYDVTLRKVEGDWRISAYTLHVTWHSGDRHVLRAAAQRRRANAVKRKLWAPR